MFLENSDLQGCCLFYGMLNETSQDIPTVNARAALHELNKYYVK